MNDCFFMANYYLQRGYSIIPLEPRGKKPVIMGWDKYRDNPPRPHEVESWWKETPEANIGLVMGSKAVAVDLDGFKKAESLLYGMGLEFGEETPRSLTGKGYHLLFKTEKALPDKVDLFKTADKGYQVDIRGKGFIVAPPSIHPDTGKEYQWIVEPPHINELPLVPDKLLALICLNRAKSNEKAYQKYHDGSWVARMIQGVPEGRRDDCCAQLVGFFINLGLDSRMVAHILINTFAKKCGPPFSDADVWKVINSISKKDGLEGK